MLTAPFYLGQLLVRKTATGGFIVSHRDDELLDQLQTFRDEEDAIEIAKYDDAGYYRPLKTAPNMRHGWRLDLATAAELRRVLDYFYPGRLAVFTVKARGRATSRDGNRDDVRVLSDHTTTVVGFADWGTATRMGALTQNCD